MWNKVLSLEFLGLSKFWVVRKTFIFVLQSMGKRLFWPHRTFGCSTLSAHWGRKKNASLPYWKPGFPFGIDIKYLQHESSFGFVFWSAFSFHSFVHHVCDVFQWDDVCREVNNQVQLGWVNGSARGAVSRELSKVWLIQLLTVNRLLIQWLWSSKKHRQKVGISKLKKGSNYINFFAWLRTKGLNHVKKFPCNCYF